MSIYLTILKQIMHTKIGRATLIENYKKKIHNAVVEENVNFPKAVQEKKYQFLVALLESTKRNLDKDWISNNSIDKLMDTLVKYGFTDKELTLERREKFKEKYGFLPPSFIVLSPTQKCNLKCEGCYSSSSHEKCPTLPYETVDKICEEVYNEWGNRFMTISGGEPLLYRDDGKTLFDIWRKYEEMFFMFYTNGTLINERAAGKLAELGNVSPAISIEGLEKHTDERRGKGIYKKILEAFENLRKAGVPFGSSVTVTQKNIDVLLDEKFYKFLFEEQGISYMWMFQLMPIGKAVNTDLMLTPEQRVQLYRVWEKMLDKGYAIADFWNSGVLSNGCIAYGRNGGYLYIDWNGNIMPCVFVPYYEDNIIELHKKGKKLADALSSGLFVNGRKWQEEYGLSHTQKPGNWLMPCSIRDHYKNFKENILTKQSKPEDEPAEKSLKSKKYEKILVEFDDKLEEITAPIWEKEYAGE